MQDFTYDSMLRKKFSKFYILFFKFYWLQGGGLVYYYTISVSFIFNLNSYFILTWTLGFPGEIENIVLGLAKHDIIIEEGKLNLLG